MSIQGGSFYRKLCCKHNSQYLPDVSFCFSSCLVVLFRHLVVAVKVLEAKRQREKESLESIQGQFLLHFILEYF